MAGKRVARVSLAGYGEKLNEMEYDAWDKQMVRDFSPGGRGMALVERVNREIAAGQAIPFAEGLAQDKTERKG